jgi:YidC/Oxa1 family membrane protein insertase
MDKNSVIGLVLMFALIFVYFQFFAPEPIQPPAKPKTTSVADTSKKGSAANKAAALPDSAIIKQNAAKFGSLAAATIGTEKNVVLENDELKITFSTKGAGIKQVALKKHKLWTGETFTLLDTNRSDFQVNVPLVNSNARLSDFYFEPTVKGKTVTFALVSNPAVKVSYTLEEAGFIVKQNLQLQGLGLKANESVSVFVGDDLPQSEKDLSSCRINSTVNFYTAEEGHDNLKESTLDDVSKEIGPSVNWVSLKNHFFSVGIIADSATPFAGAKVHSYTNQKDEKAVKLLEATVSMPKGAANGNVKWFFGPNKYKLLGTIAPGFEDNIYLGLPVINLFNKYLVVNVFYFLEGFNMNYGIIIVLLVVFIRMLLFPLNYNSFVGMAKMRVLAPEIALIKEKHGEDMAAAQQEQMKLFQSVGVNPLAGCIPLLLQLPVLLSMFNFFPNAVELRQVAFWWSDDLSTYDSIATLPFSLPGYGSHVSLFTILMTLSTLLVTWYNNQTSTVTGPMLYMSYIMPVFFMFILNTLPAGLNFYYLVSNMASMGQQFIIRSTVNETEIRNKLEANKEKNKDKPKGGFAKRLEDAMRSAEEQKKAQQNNKKKK